jgi:hypothetical protein
VYSTPWNWAIEPLHVRLFVLYLLGAGCFTLWRSVNLMRRLFSIDRVTKAALRNDVSLGPRPGERSSSTEPKTVGSVDVFRREQAAECEFSVLSEACDADIASINRLVTLTLYLSLLVVVYGAFPTWADEFNNSKVTGNMALHSAVEKLFARFTLGLSTSILLYAASSFFVGNLARRRIKWKQRCLRQ